MSKLVYELDESKLKRYLDVVIREVKKGEDPLPSKAVSATY